MKKEIIISIIILITIVSLNAITQSYTNSSLDGVSEKLTIIRDGLKEENDADVEKQIKELQEEWKTIKTKLEIYIEHTELEKIELCILEASSYIETGEDTMAIRFY